MTVRPAVLLGDGIEGLRSVQEQTATLVLADLPSGSTRAVFDRKLDMGEFWRAAWRALEPLGSVVLMASSFEFACEIRSSNPWSFKYDVIWRKSLPVGHLNSAHRPLRAHEFILVFGRQHGGIYNAQMRSGFSPIHKALRSGHGENYGKVSKRTSSRAGATDRFPVSVLDFASVGTSNKERRHPQQKPVDLLRWLVRTYSEPGDLVVDPCAGSGSTGEAAIAEGRRFIGFDSSPRFGRKP